MLRCIALLLSLISASCSSPGSRTGQVTRSECMAIAEAYRTHCWIPTSANVRHGPDAAGIQVDTPDHGYRKPGAVPGW